MKVFYAEKVFNFLFTQIDYSAIFSVKSSYIIMVYEFYEFWMQIKGKENLQT
jgi:hypothetical protein